MYRIRVFRATQDPLSCELFADGQDGVLKDFGIEKVTSSDRSWINDPNVYVFLVESKDGKEIFGGSRIHKKLGDHPLPVEDAVGYMDPKIYDLVAKDAPLGAGELCGLWNTKKARGTGVSQALTKASIAKAGVTIANLIDINVLWVLCAPYTVKMVEKAGFKQIHDVGDNGVFPYPKDDLPATVLRLADADVLSSAEDKNRKEILDLRSKPQQNKIERGPKGELIIEYNLLIEDL